MSSPDDLYAHRYAAKPLTLAYLPPGAQELARQVLDVLRDCPGLDAEGIHRRLGNRYGPAAVVEVLEILLDRFHVRREGRRQFWVHGDGRPEAPIIKKEWLAELDRKYNIAVARPTKSPAPGPLTG